MDYETLNELIGKTLKFSLEIKKVSYIPEKYTFKTCCRYMWMDNDSQFETKQCDRQKDPEFNYTYEHTMTVSEQLIHHLMYNTLTIGVYGMIESKKKLMDKAPKDQNGQEDEIQTVNDTRMNKSVKASPGETKKIRDLEK